MGALNDSVNVVPPLAFGAKSNRHVVTMGAPTGASNSNAAPGSHAVMQAGTDHSNSPILLCPVNSAPTAGAEKP